MGKCGVSRLDFTLRLQLPAGSCYQPHSRAHVRDRLTLERPSALTERKLLQQQHLHPRQNVLPLPVRFVAQQPFTPLVFSCFLLSLFSSAKWENIIMWLTNLTERAFFRSKSSDWHEGLELSSFLSFWQFSCVFLGETPKLFKRFWRMNLFFKKSKTNIFFFYWGSKWVSVSIANPHPYFTECNYHGNCTRAKMRPFGLFISFVVGRFCLSFFSHNSWRLHFGG